MRAPASVREPAAFDVVSRDRNLPPTRVLSTPWSGAAALFSVLVGGALRTRASSPQLHSKAAENNAGSGGKRGNLKKLPPAAQLIIYSRHKQQQQQCCNVSDVTSAPHWADI